MENEKYGDNDVPITDTFYIQKFMQIQRANVIMHDLLTMVYEDEQLRNRVIELYGAQFFRILEKTPL